MKLSHFRPHSRFFVFYLLASPKQNGTVCQGIYRESKEERMRPKKRELHELPYTKNCTIRGLLDSPYAFFGPNLHGN